MDEENKQFQRLFKLPHVEYHREEWSTLKNSQINTPIVIDHGSYECRVGWAGEEDPRLIFPCIAAKYRPSKGYGPPIRDEYVGNDFGDFKDKPSMFPLISPFDKSSNVIVNMEAEELILDYCFAHMGFEGQSSVARPVLITEPYCNTSYSRDMMSEQLFECYGVPSISYGVDSLFALLYNSWCRDLKPKDDVMNDKSYKMHPKLPTPTAMVLSCNHYSTYLMPVIDGNCQYASSCRIPVGGCSSTTYLQQVLHARNPPHRKLLDHRLCDIIKKDHCYVATDYEATLIEYENNMAATPPSSTFDVQQSLPKRPPENEMSMPITHTIQVPFIPQLVVVETEEEKERKRLLRVQRGKELAEMRKKMKAMKDGAGESSINADLDALGGDEDNSSEAIIIDMQEEGVESVEHNHVMVTDDAPIAQTSAPTPVPQPAPTTYIAPASTKPKDATGDLEKLDEFDLMLLAEKGEIDFDSDAISSDDDEMHYMIKMHRQKIDKKKGHVLSDDQTARIRKEYMRIPMESDAMVTGAPHGLSAAAAAKLAAPEKGKKRPLVVDEDDEDRPSSAPNVADLEASIYSRAYNEQSKFQQIHMSVERVAAPEVLWQPKSLLGYDKPGIAEALSRYLGRYSHDHQESLCKYIYVYGGPAETVGFKERLVKELRSIRPVTSTPTVVMADDLTVDAWRGASLFGWYNGQHGKVPGGFMTKQQYEECGVGYLAMHAYSNVWVDQHLDQQREGGDQ